MARSMTGFGRCEINQNGFTVLAELRAVNHRYFEFSLRCPKSCLFLEDALKKTLQQRIARGKVDLSLSVTFPEDDGSGIEINHSFAKGYVNKLRELAKEYKLKKDISLSLVASQADVFTFKKADLDEKALSDAVVAAVQGAVDIFVEMRRVEGERLASDVLLRTNTILGKVEFVEQRSPETVKEYNQKIKAKIEELLGDAQVDEQRLITEVAIFADKVAVAEETVRLRSHIAQLVDMLPQDLEIGRKLDFVVQEMNREANTIGSKAQDVEIARAVVDIKAEIEKIREQIQNIE